jgi:hypothetical protein
MFADREADFLRNVPLALAADYMRPWQEQQSLALVKGHQGAGQSNTGVEWFHLEND